MRTIIINENERGLLFKNGKFIRLLGAGKYRVFGGRDIEKLDLTREVRSGYCGMDKLLSAPDIAKNTVCADVADEQYCFHFVDGRLAHALSTGKHAFWNDGRAHEFIYADVSTPEVSEDFPTYVFDKLSTSYYYKVEVEEYQKGVIYFNRKLAKVLDAGTYYFWRGSTRVDVEYVDTRILQMDVTGQEVLTRDKVSLRINLTLNYRVTDCVKISTEVGDFREQLHVCAQLALREYVGKHTLDEILETKQELSEYVWQKLREKEAELFVEISFAGVKDIILPGEIRDIMNTVLVAEKRAQANVITRREEVASTRSLLNTAKLMDENKTLYKLKELEYIERICENVGTLTLNAGGDILSQLTGILRNGE